jgi:hypothetical protein
VEKSTPCLAKLAASLAGSNSNCMHPMCASSIHMSSPSSEGAVPSAPSRLPHFSSHRATGNTEAFQNFSVSGFSATPVSARCLLTALRSGCPPGLHICLSLWTCAIARVFAPSHVVLRAAWRQGWFAFLPKCLTLRATHVAYRANPRLLGSQPAPAGMCS